MFTGREAELTMGELDPLSLPAAPCDNSLNKEQGKTATVFHVNCPPNFSIPSLSATVMGEHAGQDLVKQGVTWEGGRG